MLDLKTIPRDKLNKPASYSNFKCTDEDEKKLTKWMLENLELRVLVTNDPVKDEISYIEAFNPPLNLTGGKGGEVRKKIKKLRKQKAVEACSKFQEL